MADSATYDIVSPAAKAALVLRREIREGRYSVGEQLANERTLAERFGVSRGTIRKAMKMLESERLIARQQGRGTFVANPTFGPVPGSNQTALIGAIIHDKVEYFAELLRAASSQSTVRGYVMTTGSNVALEEELQHIDALIRSGIRGVLLTPRSWSAQGYRRLRESQVPVVLVDNQLPGIDEDFVSVDDRRGTALATAHLIELGHKRLAYLGHGYVHDVPTMSDRIGGFVDTCRAAGLTPTRVLLSEEENFAGPLRELLSQRERPTAFVTYNDEWAVRLVNLARSMQFQLPRDLSVVGFDDGPAARNHAVSITSVYPECREIGVSAVNVLVDKIDNPRKRAAYNLRITPRLVVRESSGKPLKDA